MKGLWGSLAHSCGEAAWMLAGMGGEVFLIVGVEGGEEGVEEKELAFEDLDVLLDGDGLGDVGWAVVLAVLGGLVEEGSEAEDDVASGLAPEVSKRFWL